MQQAELRPAMAADYAVLAGWVGSKAAADLFAGAAHLRWPLMPESLPQALAMPQRHEGLLGIRHHHQCLYYELDVHVLSLQPQGQRFLSVMG